MKTILTVPASGGIMPADDSYTVLRRKCVPIESIDSGIRGLAKELCELMDVVHQGLIIVGISAPQVGELVRLFAYRANPYSAEPSTQVVINPELVYAKGVVTLKETCLSVPETEVFVGRHKLVKIRGLNLDGELRSFKGSGLIAQMFEHELNHLDGVLIDQVGHPVLRGDKSG